MNEYTIEAPPDRKQPVKQEADSPGRSPKGKRDKMLKKKAKKAKLIENFCEAEFKRSFHDMNNKHSGEGKTFDEKQAIKQKLNEEYESLFRGEQKRDTLKKQIQGQRNINISPNMKTMERQQRRQEVLHRAQHHDL